MTSVAIHQPDFLPYPGFFNKMLKADIFILYDTAKYSKRGYHNRNRIKTSRGPDWLTVPARSPAVQPICSIEIDNSQDWGRRISRSLEVNYGRASYFDTYAGEFLRILRGRGWTRLAALNAELLSLVRRLVSIDTKLLWASSLPPCEPVDPTSRLIEMVHAVGGDVYLSGPGGKGYLDEAKFVDVELEFANPLPAEYPQLWGPFAPNLSIVDALFNCGPETGRILFSERS